MLSISESLLNDLIAAGSIRTVSAGRRCLVPLVAMNDFLAGDSGSAPSAPLVPAVISAAQFQSATHVRHHA